MEAFTYKGIADGKYVTGDIEAINQEEASHKLKRAKNHNYQPYKNKKRKKVKPRVKAKVRVFHLERKK